MDIKKIIREEYDNINGEIVVYHGTDNEFNDFDLDKIGSGDGRSIGGWGIYFSDNSRVADQYRSRRGVIKKYALKNGEYFDLDAAVESGSGDMIIQGLRRKRVDENEIEEFENEYNVYGVNNKQALEWLTYVLGGEKQVSLFLKWLGFDGNQFMDKTIPNANNFVVYNTDIIRDKNVEDEEDDY